MCLIYGISFFFSLFGIFGVGHLFVGAPQRAIAYFVAGLIWSVLAGVIGLSSGLTLFICFGPLHLLFAHFCAADATRLSRPEGAPLGR
ncbi:MAG: hypothetical protein ACLFTK_07280 [Anaerolineales bacterium]